MARTSYGIPKLYTGGAWTITSWRASSGVPAVAHRGAPNVHTRGEFTRESFARAVSIGFGALEGSAQRSSDGVWVLNHDSTTGEQWNGTSLTIASTPWSTLQTLTPKYGDPAQRMYRLDAWLTDYASTHVLLVENKTYNNFAEFEALLNAADPTRVRIVAKHGGEGTSNNAYFHDRGYTTWGYFFGDTGVSGAQNLPTVWGPHLDWVGLSSGPSNLPCAQTWWDWCRDRSIPVIAHVAKTPDDWTSMKAQGAKMVMLNNDTMFPVS